MVVGLMCWRTCLPSHLVPPPSVTEFIGGDGRFGPLLKHGNMHFGWFQENRTHTSRILLLFIRNESRRAVSFFWLMYIFGLCIAIYQRFEWVLSSNWGFSFFWRNNSFIHCVSCSRDLSTVKDSFVND